MTRRRRSRKGRRRSPRLARWLIKAGAGVLCLLVVWTLWLDWRITSRFEGRRWDQPAQVYAEAMDLYPELDLDANGLVELLRAQGYRPADGREVRPGTWWREGTSVRLVTRPFRFQDGLQEAIAAQVDFAAGRIGRIRDTTGIELALLRLDPMRIGSIFPSHGEDRIVLPPEEVPALLANALIAVEDRRFYTHYGIDPEGIARAVLVNLKSGEVKQGGSTLTQQLVKSYFLDNRQTLGRKVTEAAMALLLELHYTKDDLLNAYVNEVYMGQDGPRAIHGFGLAAAYYFGKRLDELDTVEIATLVAIVRGPSWYRPWQSPERVRQRRDLVLALLGKQGVLTKSEVVTARAQSMVLRPPGRADSGYRPAFLQLVRRQLARDYEENDLSTEGLSVLTTLEPRVQSATEAALRDGLKALESRGGEAVSLEAAAIVTRPATGEVLAVAGGREAAFGGFNRALDARRPIGSLVKPALYLAALETGRYHLATTVEDMPLEVPLPRGDVWVPRNYDGEPHGPVSLLRALAESHNLAAVRTGLDVGTDTVAERLGELAGIDTPPAYPSLLLGSVEMSPVEVAQLYGVFASGGFRAPLRAVKAVLDAEGTPLSRYPLDVEQVADPEAVAQIDRALLAVMERGTGRRAREQLPGLALAGKTGTSGDFRDSWFAGFGGDNLAVVWVGRDDNRATGLTGSSGALPVWVRLMSALGPQPFVPAAADGLVELEIEYDTGLAANADCADVVRVPLPAEARLTPKPGCGPAADNLAERGVQWLKRVLGGG